MLLPRKYKSMVLDKLREVSDWLAMPVVLNP